MNALLSSLAIAYRTVLRNPQYRGWVMVGSLLYLLSPIDLSPDIVPILGQIDDVALMALLFSEVSQQLVAALRDRSRFGGGGKPSSGAQVRTQSSSADARYTQTVDVQATPVDRPSK